MRLSDIRMQLVVSFISISHSRHHVIVVTWLRDFYHRGGEGRSPPVMGRDRESIFSLLKRRQRHQNVHLFMWKIKKTAGHYRQWEGRTPVPSPRHSGAWRLRASFDAFGTSVMGAHWMGRNSGPIFPFVDQRTDSCQNF